MTEPTPGEIAYDPRTALLVVDVQNDFADRAGSLAVAGGPWVVRAANAHVDAATAAGAHVVYTQDWHPRRTPHFAVNAPEGAGGTWPVHCVQDTWGAALHPELPVPWDAVAAVDLQPGDGERTRAELVAAGVVVL